MPRTITNKFNRGEIDERAFVRDDVEEVNNTCELMENWLPRRGGWMQYRPGTESLGACKTGVAHRIIPFVDDGDVPTLLEFSSTSANPSAETVRIWSNDALLTVTATADTIANGDFALNITGWTEDNTGAGDCAWDSDLGGRARITGGPSAGDSGALYQTVATTAGERTIELLIDESPLLVQIGTTGSRSNDIFEGLLSPGYHMLTYTADGSNVTYTVSNTNAYYGFLRTFDYKATGTFELEAPFFTSTDTLGSTLETVRYTQINDVLFLTSAGYYLEGGAWPLINVRRWGSKSWSFELPHITDGPFGALNDSTITLYPSVRTGNGTLTASNDFFTSKSVGKMYKLVHGETEGICIVRAITSTTIAEIAVYKAFGSSGNKAATRDWFEGRFAYYLPSPTTVDVYQNRLWLAGGARLYGSVSDLFLSFDETIDGDSAAIQKTIALGPVQEISWLAGGDELFIGLTAEEMRVTSTADFEAVTQNNITLRRGTNRGSKNVQSVVVNGLVYFIQRSGKKLISLTGLRGEEAVTQDTTVLHPSITSPGIRRIAYTAEPEPRMYVLLTDGTLRCMLFDNVENITAWSRIAIGGGATVVDLATVPSGGDDQIYVVVDRSGISRSIEHFVDEDTAIGQSDSRHYDSHMVFTSPGATCTGLTHLEGVTVDVWADGQPRGRALVSGGSITLDESVWTDVVVGVRHTAKWKSNRIARYIDESVFNYRKRISQIGLIARDFAVRTFRYGPSADDLHNMPDIEDGRPRPPSTDPYPTIIDTVTGTVEGPMKVQDVALYGDYIITACDSVPSPPDTNRYQRFAIYETNGKCYLPGGDAGATAQVSNYSYDPVAEVLIELANLHKAVTEQCVTIDNVAGQVYCYGAAAGGSDNFQMYDIATDTWFAGTTGTTIDQPTRAYPKDAHMVEYDEKVYVHGGDNSGVSVADFAIYDIATDTWDNAPVYTGTPTATRRGGYAAPRLGSGAGMLYFFGGYEGTLTDSKLFQRYEVATATWSTLSNTGSGAARQSCMLAAPGDSFIYLWGGKPRVGTTNYDPITYQFDIDAGTWSFILGSGTPEGSPTNPYATTNFGMFGDTGNQKGFYKIGGEGQNGSTSVRHRDVWYYDTTTDQWTEVAAVISPLAGAIRAFDASDPDAIATADAININNETDDVRGFAVLVDESRDLAFILGIEDDDATINKSLALVDISDPTNLSVLHTLVGGTAVSTNNKALAFDGRFLYVPSLTTNGTIDVVDTAKTTSMSIVGSVTPTFDTNAVNPQRMLIDDGYLHISWEDDWHVIDITDPYNPVVVSEEPTTTNMTGLLYNSNNTIVVRDGDFFVHGGPSHGVVHIWRKNTHLDFEYLSSTTLDANMTGIVDIQVFWPYIYVACPTITLVVDATNPLSPSVIATYQGYTDVTSMFGPSPGLFFSGSNTSSGLLFASDVRSWELIDYDEMSFEFPGVFDTDTRLYFECTGPATILQVSFEIEDVDYPQRGSDGPNQP